MSSNSLPRRRLRAAGVLPQRASRLDRTHTRLRDGARTTLHVATYELHSYAVRVVAFPEPIQLIRWCRQEGVRHAVVGGFFARPAYAPLGQLWIAGEAQESMPFDAPWGDVRAGVQIDRASIRIGRRDELDPEPAGDLLQAGPLLVRDGRRVVEHDEDAEGFSAGSHQFDSDITLGRYPRAALAVAGDRMFAVACDGRGSGDVGMTLAELADALVALGASEALNLDGGGSASLVYEGRLRNRPREQNGADLLEGRPVVTAIVFDEL
jgi:hypothetical protein